MIAGEEGDLSFMVGHAEASLAEKKAKKYQGISWK